MKTKLEGQFKAAAWAGFFKGGMTAESRGRGLEAATLCAETRQRTGLEDFGDPPLNPALPILTESLEREANLHPLGRFLMRIHLRELLGARLRWVACCKGRAEEIAKSAPVAPVFIVGMPRSGSTFLHELLSQDPALRAPRVWEVMSPERAGESDRGWRDSRVWHAAWCLWCFRRLAPRADAVYPMRARTPHECVAIHSHTFLSEEFVSTCHIPTYKEFLRSADLRPAYEWEKRFLSFLQCGSPKRRWVLKSPDHVRSLDALLAVFPDATIIHTHRHPLDSLRSSIQLTEVLQRLYGRPQSRDKLAEREAENLAWSVTRMIQFRDEHPELADRFLDVNYTELASDPMAIVLRLYRHLRIPLSNEAIFAMQNLVCRRSVYRGRRTVPEIADLGLDRMEQLRLFGKYCRRFGISLTATHAP
jgi:LPS sulfotransferase NodH